jgi:uncharacterized protein YjbI with pentapeptide repeats/cellulose biosynthesis protein BcsQ
MKILAVTSGKGGVGKTTISLNIARQMSIAGIRTLIVDFDIHNKGATCLFMDKVAKSATQSITGIMAQCPSCSMDIGQKLAEEIKLVDLGYENKLLLLPSALPDQMVKWESFVCSNESLVDFFRNFLEKVAARHHIDVILIDCYGGVDTLTIAAAGISDDLIIVNEPDVITFAGTLLLYKQLASVYHWATQPPRVHFIINRISVRHGFRFLQAEYQEKLAPLAVDRTVLAYLPFDKLVFDTFGHYPFFSELLPKGLYSKKICELIARLWPVAPFVNMTVRSTRKRERIYEATAENPFADPERIFQAWKNCAWALFPVMAMLFLYKSPGSISFLALRSTFYVCLIFCSALVVLGVLFEPWQVSRWLVRKAHYEGRRRELVEGSGITNRFRAWLDSIASWTPGSLGVLCFSLIVLVSYGLQLLYPFRNVSIWHNEITGFTRHGNYQKLIMAPKSGIQPRTDLSSSTLDEAKLVSVLLPQVNLRNTTLRLADLKEAKFIGDDLRETDFSQANLTSADLSGSATSNAKFTDADLMDAHLWGSSLSDAHFNGQAILYLTDFRQSDLRGADFSQAIIKNTDFDGADLKGADFRSANFDYMDSDRRGELFAQLEHRGAIISGENSVIGKAWMRKNGYDQPGELQAFRFRNGEKLSPAQTASAKKWDANYGDTPWWLHWKPGEPAHLHDYIEPRIKVLTNSLQNGNGHRSPQLTSEGLVNLLAKASDFATMSDLVELLLARGTETDLEIAGKVLAERKKQQQSPESDDEKRDYGVILMLSALHSIITKAPQEQADIQAWQAWLSTPSREARLVGWSWNMWDDSFPALRYSGEQVAKIRVLRLSAMGQISPNQVSRWFISAPPAPRTLKASK